MAEIGIGIAVALLQQAIPAAIRKLKARFQQAKATEGETRELEELLRCVRDCYTQYQISHVGTVKTSRTDRGPSSSTSSFVKTLGEVQKTLEWWSGQDSGFFSRSSSERVQELQGLGRKVDNAIKVETFRMVVSIFRHVNDLQAPVGHPPQIEPPTPIQNPRHCPPARVEAPRKNERNKTNKVSTDHGRSNSTGRVRPNPSNPPALGRSRSKSVQPDRHHSSHRGEESRTVDLWVPLDSYKQAKDIENKLMGLEDVKKVFYDLVTKKVTVMPSKGSQVRSATLLSEIQNALPKGKVAPTLWFKRPR